ncbi:MAG: TIGR00730 family Rossman fold protein [Candidatus Rokubacteria bacterium]|nr:TIGR00730 family Rossman fold protein [Candidatus Rokubacteria bacterium]
MKRVCVFCGSSAGSRTVYREAAVRMGMVLARRGIGMVFGGGSVGLMGAVADAALAAGGEVLGVIPRALVEKELAHRGVADLRVVASMHERKALMAELADAFVALPGGYGTLEEFCEVVTWAQLGIHRKPCGLLNVTGFFDSLLALFDHAVAEGFLRLQHRALIVVEKDPERLLDALAAWEPPAIEKWVRQEEI